MNIQGNPYGALGEGEEVQIESRAGAMEGASDDGVEELTDPAVPNNASDSRVETDGSQGGEGRAAYQPPSDE